LAARRWSNTFTNADSDSNGDTYCIAGCNTNADAGSDPNRHPDANRHADTRTGAGSERVVRANRYDYERQLEELLRRRRLQHGQ
jgi:hypothetical protein